MRQNVLTGLVFVVLIALFALSANDWQLPWAGSPAHASDWCKPHETPLSACEKCNPRLARGGTYTVKEREPREGECPNTLVRIHLGPGVARQVNLTLATAELREVAETLKANAETLYAPAQYARVAPRIAGALREIKAVLGQDVEAGAVLAVLESPEFGRAKFDYHQSQAVLKLRQKTYEQEKALFEGKISTARDLLKAETDLEEARLALRKAAQTLSALGLPGEPAREDGSPLFELKAPFAGRVVEASAVPGDLAGPEKPLFSVAFVERLWVSIDVTEADLPKIEKDQRVQFFVDGLVGKRFPGRVVAVGGEVDDRTRTVRVFADVKNVDGLLRARMFGRAELAIKAPEPRLVVPREAVQHDGDCYLVFASPTPDAFQARKVQIGRVYERGYEIVAGLVAGEKIAVTGSFLLKTEVLKGQIGAG